MMAMMSESGSNQRKSVNPGGRPAKNPADKKTQKSVYLTTDVIEFLQTIDSNLSAAIEKLAEDQKHK